MRGESSGWGLGGTGCDESHVDWLPAVSARFKSLEGSHEGLCVRKARGFQVKMERGRQKTERFIRQRQIYTRAGAAPSVCPLDCSTNGHKAAGKSWGVILISLSHEYILTLIYTAEKLTVNV